MTIIWPIREILLGEGSLGKLFLLHKKERSIVFPSLPACTLTSEAVMCGAMAATLQPRGDKTRDKSWHAYDSKEQILKELGSLMTRMYC